MTVPERLPPGMAQARVGTVVLHADDPHDIRRQKLARIILDEMYQFLGLLDVSGNVVDINRAALEGAGIVLEEIIGRPFWEAHWWAVSDDIRNRVKGMIARAAAGQFVRCDIEIYGGSRGTQTIFVDFSLTPIRDSAGQVVFLLPEGRNISEKIAAEAELTRKNGELQQTLEKVRQLNGFKTEFFANVSHELRTPLALILGPLEQLLKDGDQFGERDRFRLDMIRRNTQMLLQHVNDLLDLARIDADKMPMVYSKIDIAALLAELATNFDAALAERGIALRIEGAPELYADIDRAKFERVVVNLLSNALKFSPAGSRIGCSLQAAADSHFLLSIQDSGPGVPEATKELIFGRFSQGQPMHSGVGSGLGLSIVKEFVELHHGTVAVLDAPGGGAIFQVELPMDAPDGAFVRNLKSLAERDLLPPLPPDAALPARPAPVNHAGAAARATAAGRSTPGTRVMARILVAEDNEDLRNFLCDTLVDDYLVLAVADGKAALAAAEANPPDLVVSDLMMPQVDGLQLIRALRSDARFAHVPVLILSARVDDVLREQLLSGQVQDYVTKPFSPQELRARIRNLVSMKLAVDILQKELDSQVSDISELTRSLVSSRISLQQSFLAQQVSEQRWLGIYQNSAVGIALADRNGRVLAANPTLQKMLGYEERELLGISLVEITKPAHRAMTMRNMNDLFGGDQSEYHLQKCYEKHGGDVLWANVSVSLIPAVGQEEPRMAVIVEDITSRRLAETALASTQAELARVSRLTTMGELVATIAHEINQPLSAIRTNSQAGLRWLDREEPDYKEVHDALSRVNRDAVRAGEVISRTRNFLRISAARREDLKVQQVLDDLFLMLRDLFAESGVRLETRVLALSAGLRADTVQLQQVLLNLVLNAIDAMRARPANERLLSVTVEQRDDLGVVFSVQDSGPGVPREQADQIFQAFFSTKDDGLGMGLTISRSVIEAHGGRLWLTEGSPTGARFVFNIPVDP